MGSSTWWAGGAGTSGLVDAARWLVVTVLRDCPASSIDTGVSSTWPRTAIHATHTPGRDGSLAKSELVTFSGIVVSSTVPVGSTELEPSIVDVAGSSAVSSDSEKKNEPTEVAVAFCAAAVIAASTPGSPWPANLAIARVTKSVRVGGQLVTLSMSLLKLTAQLRTSRCS